MPVDASIANDLFLSSAQRFITQSAKCICIKKKKAQCEKLVIMEALEEIYQCKRHIWLALNNINTVLSLILCMFCVWEWKCICCYFFLSVPVCLSSFAAQKTTLCRCRQYWQRYEFLGTQYPETILQLTQEKCKVYINIYRIIKMKKITSLWEQFPLLEMWMFYSPRLSTVCF